MASKTDAGISLIPAVGLQNIFVKVWKPNFYLNSRMKIASVAFLRNIVEMTTGNKDQNYLDLTAMLHWKEGKSEAITIGHLDDIYSAVCGKAGTSADLEKSFFELLDAEAKNCLTLSTSTDLENKIVLAIAIRITAERYMIKKINDLDLTGNIKRNQTPELVKIFKGKFPTEATAIRTLDEVCLMTPEAIHVNSFMYEPIIDMSDDQLRKLYTDVLALT